MKQRLNRAAKSLALATLAVAGLMIVPTACGDRNPVGLSSSDLALMSAGGFISLGGGSSLLAGATDANPEGVCYSLYSDISANFEVFSGCGDEDIDPPVTARMLYIEPYGAPWDPAHVTVYFYEDWDEEEGGDCEMPDPSNLVPTNAGKFGINLRPVFLCDSEETGCSEGWIPDGNDGCLKMEVCGSAYDPILLALGDSNYTGDFSEIPECVDSLQIQQGRPNLGKVGNTIRSKCPSQDQWCMEFFERWWKGNDTLYVMSQARFDSVAGYARTSRTRHRKYQWPEQEWRGNNVEWDIRCCAIG